MGKRAALYVRVSTEKQNTANQLPDLERLAALRGYGIAAVYEETESGAKRRPVLEKLLSECGRFDAVIVWALDRLGRGGALEALQIVARFDREHVGVLSVQESWLDTSIDNPMRDVLIAFSATVAKMERKRLIDRTNAGLARARAEGKKLGRPSADAMVMGTALLRRQAGSSYREAVAGLTYATKAGKARPLSVSALRRYELRAVDLAAGLSVCAEKGS
jgi:putative DNA-invertase from lambdoid prophage Rac